MKILPRNYQLGRDKKRSEVNFTLLALHYFNNTIYIILIIKINNSIKFFLR